MANFIPGWNFWNKSFENQIVDYMEKDLARGAIQPGLKILLCFRSSVNFLTEICVLPPGWNWACNRNNISARWAERNLSPGRNSPCNQALREMLGLILNENSFQFNGKNYLQTHGTAMGNKMAVSFTNIFIAKIETTAKRMETIYWRYLLPLGQWLKRRGSIYWTS